MDANQQDVEFVQTEPDVECILDCSSKPVPSRSMSDPRIIATPATVRRGRSFERKRRMSAFIKIYLMKKRALDQWFNRKLIERKERELALEQKRLAMEEKRLEWSKKMLSTWEELMDRDKASHVKIMETMDALIERLK